MVKKRDAAKRLYLECFCWTEGLQVVYWSDEPLDEREVHFSTWTEDYYSKQGPRPWKYRLRDIWKILRTGEPWQDQVTLHADGVEKLRDFLNEALTTKVVEVKIKASD